MIERWTGPFLFGALPPGAIRHGARRLAATLIVLAALVAPMLPAAAQQSEGMDAGAAEDVAAGATIVRGDYDEGGAHVDWEAAVRDGQPIRFVEWRSYGADGHANVILSFYNGKLMHYAEQSQRRLDNASRGLVQRRLEMSFRDGTYSHGSKTVDGRTGEPDEADIRAAQAAAAEALRRVAVTKPAWQDSGRTQGGSNFSILSLPPPPGPSEESRRLAGEGEQIVFRCQDDSLFAILGAKADALVVAPPGADPVVLARQPQGARYDYLGNGWAAQRMGDELRLEQATGRAIRCSHE